MSRENKALLLNIFVCPGGGHWYLGKKLTGSIIFLVTAISLSMMMTDILSVSQQIADDMVAGRLPMNVTTIMAEVHQRTLSLKGLELAFWLLVGSWAIGVLDSLRLLMTTKQSEK